MILKSFQVKNFKCFYDSDTIELKQGFNVFVGQNNSGKTTLLEAISRDNLQRPHMSNHLSINQTPNPLTTLSMEFQFSGEELKLFLLSSGNDLIVKQPADVNMSDPKIVDEYIRNIFACNNLNLKGEYLSTIQAWTLTGEPLNARFGIVEEHRYCTFRPNTERNGFILAGYGGGGRENSLDLGRGLIMSQA